MALVRIGVDIGGTFTDFVGWRSDSSQGITRLKVPSTPPHFAEGFKDGFEPLLDQLRISDDDEVVVMHGTTVSTNTVIERSAEPIALFVTEGFRDILELQRLRLKNPVDLFSSRAIPLVARDLVFEIPERLNADGEVLTPIDAEAVRRAVAGVKATGVKAIAVVFLHSFRNPKHEREIRGLINEIDPEMDVCISSEIWPRIGEYERAVNATLNAYVKPRVQAYLQEIERYVTNRLSSVRLFVTRSNGGALGLADAAKFPVHTLLSGPASGVTAAQTVSSLSKHEYLLTFDMGGTSTDVSLVRQGNPTVTSQGAVGDFPITLPVTEIEAIGAGGGSLVHLEGPAMRIGPESAGAYPGPAAFGRGGVRPTVTDAYLLCGYLNAGNFLGGAMPLDVIRAATAYDSIAGRLSVTTAEAADACLSVTTSTMVSRILPYLAAHGLDPQNVTLVTFGGNGALHGPLLADEVGINSVIVPAAPSVFCACGGVVTTLTHDVVNVIQGTTITHESLSDAFRHLALETVDWLKQQVELDRLTSIDHEFWAELRYKGQSFQVPVVVPTKADGSFPDLATISDRFHDEHNRLYAHCDRNAAVEFVELRVRIRGSLPSPSQVNIEGSSRRGEVSAIARRDLRIAGRLYPNTPIYARSDLERGSRVEGPCIIEEDDSTILVPPAYTAEAISSGAISLDRRG
ncbi:hydantoinase/oxoprolinase family protein [Agrobacterium vitis]|uniref:Hydantoinase/oxoprolinase family protein n=1 Tax=Agrobacterium vitis TaxID=373 RepID=A0A7K1RN79_AGRVI|nr:hydantoinase/oxoprolinase family protein [Agrobacterium vitis]MVA59500.1 hydantoinase/oxoprolinase family protein [Agrobacterium vitis]